MSTTELKKISINSFKGIAPNSPVIIDFNDMDKNIVYLQGDQHEGKTSTLEGIMWLMGASLGVNIKEMYNHKNPIDEEMEFEHEGREYKVIASADKIVVKSLREGDGNTKDKWVNEPSPKDLLQKIFKKCIIEQKFQYEKPEKQIEWVANLFPLPKEVDVDGEMVNVKSFITQTKDKIKEMKDVTRPKIGNEMKSYETILKSNPLYAEYQEKGEALEKEIKKLDKGQDKLEKFKTTSEKHQQYNTAISGLKSLEEDKVRYDKELQELNKQMEEIKLKIELKKSEVSGVEKRIQDGKEYIDKNKGIVKQYEDALELQKSSNETTLRIDNYEKMKENLKMYNEKSDQYQKIDAEIKETIAGIKSFVADYIPKIEGVEVISEEEMEEGVVTKEIGIYLNGVNLRTLSGSEYVTTMIKIIHAANSNFIFIDNLATYGTETIEYINHLAKEIQPQGGVVFASELQRGSELIISLEDEIS